MTFNLPTMMKAAVVDKAGPPDMVHITSVPVPHLTRDHVIIALDYASVGIWDAEQRSGAWGPVKPGTILGADGSGTVAAVSADVKRLQVGERVYSYSYANPHGGFHAEYVSVPADRVELVPDQLDQEVAGALPCVALTAHPGLRVLKVRRGETLLVFGASGGVGSLAVWLAAHATEATVVGTARPDAHDYVRALGAAHVVDPNSQRRDSVIREAAPKGFDVALVTANGQDLPAFLSHLRPNAPVAYPNGVEPEIHVDGHPSLPFDGEMSREAFELLNKAIGKRSIPLRVEVFALDRAADAHRRIEEGHVVGKIVLRIRG
jgi:NADPH:quinone reductase